MADGALEIAYRVLFGNPRASAEKGRKNGQRATRSPSGFLRGGMDQSSGYRSIGTTALGAVNSPFWLTV